MKSFLKLLILLIAASSIIWGLILISLGFLGVSVTPQKVDTRRLLGERNETHPNKYAYAIYYEFFTAEGELISGHTRSIGNSYSVEKPRKIFYFNTYPQINAPEKDCGIGTYPIALLCIGSLIIWAVSRVKRTKLEKTRTQRKSSKKPPLKKTRHAVTYPVNSLEWLKIYRRNSKRYAWLFFTGVVVTIGILVRIGLDEFNREWLYATGFAAFVTWALALYSRRKEESSWYGVISSKEIETTEDTRTQGTNATRTSYIINVKTHRGRHKKIRVKQTIFDAYTEGSRIWKIAGLSFPITEGVDEMTAFCPVCGNLLNNAKETCPSCRAPVLDWEEIKHSG